MAGELRTTAGHSPCGSHSLALHSYLTYVIAIDRKVLVNQASQSSHVGRSQDHME